MPVTVVVGGQFGSEGKGKVSHWFTREEKAAAAIRVGGTNSGHTVVDPTGKRRVFRQLPTGAILDGVSCVLPAGAYIDPDTLLSEVAMIDLPKERLFIDPLATLIGDREREEERKSRLKQEIGSTLSGTGAAVARRISRDGSARLARDDDRLAPFLQHTVPYLRQLLDQRRRIVIEGTQGYGLSLLHSSDYPRATSRDTTAAAFVAEAGLSPLDVDQVILVLRAFPIRVAGNSGHLPEEIDWSTLARESGYASLTERTSVTNAVRRVARFDPGVVVAAIQANQPTAIVLNHVDYFDATCAHEQKITRIAMRHIRGIERRIGRAFDYLGVGPDHLVACSIGAPSKCLSLAV